MGSWKSRPKSFQVSVLETASVKIQAPKLRSQVLKTMSWNFPGPKVQIPSPENHVLKTISWPPCPAPALRHADHVLSVWSQGKELYIIAWRFLERTAVAVPVLIRLPRKEWRVGRTDALREFIYKIPSSPWSLDSPSPIPHPISLSQSQIFLSCARYLVLLGSLVRSLSGFRIRLFGSNPIFRIRLSGLNLVSESDCPGRFPADELKRETVVSHTNACTTWIYI